MPQSRKSDARALFADPNNEPLKVVDMVSFHPVIGREFDVTLCTLVSKVVGKDQTVREPIVAVRLRLSIGMAKAITEGMARQIAVAEAAASVKN